MAWRGKSRAWNMGRPGYPGGNPSNYSAFTRLSIHGEGWMDLVFQNQEGLTVEHFEVNRPVENGE